MATGRTIVKRALDQLRPTITTEDARKFFETTSGDIRRAAREIEEEQGARLELRFMRRIEPFLLSLESYASVIEVFCQGYSPMAFIWGPIKLMLLLARNYTTVMENILQAFTSIAEVLPRMDRLKATFSDNADFTEAIGLIYSDILEFFQRAYKFFRCKGWHFWFTFHWGLFERRFNAILHRLSSHCDLVDREAASIHFMEMKKFRDLRQNEEEAFEQRRHTQMAESVFRWLSAAQDDQEEHLHRISDMRQPETCNWILEDPQAQPWVEVEGGDPVLWVTGIPGSGKSFLCSLIIEHLQTRADRSSLYYFCGKRVVGGDNRAIILRTLAYQLLQQNPTIIPLIHQAYLEKMSNRSGPALETMLKDVLPTVKVTRIVIDGIDECDHTTQREILRCLVKIQRLANCDCKLLVSSREEPQIQQSLPSKRHMRLGQKTSEALSIYIRDKVSEVGTQFPELKATLLALIEQRLNSKANGMFLWVRLVVSMLTQQISEEDIECAIDQLPDGLDEAYGNILSRLKSTKSVPKDRIMKILYWVCVAYRPIKIHEVVDGIALRHCQTVLHRKTRSNNPRRDIVDVCAPLLEISASGTLSLVHFSAREYLVDRQSGPFIDIHQAHLSISLSCIINLTSCLDLVPGYRSNMTDARLETRVVQGSYGLHSYGHEFWAEHVLAYLAQVNDPDVESKTLIEYLHDLAPMHKHPTEHMVVLPSNLSQGNMRLGLAQLKRYPPLFNFVSSWLIFKAALNEAKQSFDTLEVQKTWQLRKDVTYLTVIALRVSELTERLLMMVVSNLPSHIDKSDFIDFARRFDLPCRFLDCKNSYRSVQDREGHEASHVPSFPCLQCDFAIRGFRSRKDLEKHIQRYHTNPEDFEIPVSLGSAVNHSRSSGKEFTNSTPRMSSCWNGQGRKALQRGFGQVLAKFESNQASGSGIELKVSQQAELDNLREKVEKQHYHNLADFKTDLRLLYTAPDSTAALVHDDDVGYICDAEFEKAVSEFPAFASLSPKSFKGLQTRAIFGASEGSTMHAGNSVGHESDMASLETHAAEGRRPYWSTAEEKQFPELLQRCGRDFLKIADYLKTKTAEEVGQHLVDLLQSGRDLSDLAGLADSRLQQEHGITNTVTDDPIDGAEKQVVDDTGSQFPISLAGSSRPLEVISPYSARLGDLSTPDTVHRDRENVLKRSWTATEANMSVDDSQKRKRRPRRRALCNFCSAELHDEYAVKKHVLRFHNATRKVWICEDVSIDKKFLSKCKPCSASRRYNSRNNASKHLRQDHFEDETSVDTLRRWVREIEEPNPNYQKSKSESPSTRHPISMGPKTGEKLIHLAPIQTNSETSLDSSKVIPSMRLQDPILASPGGLTEDSDGEEYLSNEGNQAVQEIPGPAKQGSKAFSNAELLPDIPFDNVSPCLPTPGPDGIDHPLHRANKALIKPDQVARLPHLGPSRKLVCQDQVTALYRRLDKEQVGSPKYEDYLKDLTSLSRQLRNDLRDWRRHETYAPELPFSI